MRVKDLIAALSCYKPETPVRIKVVYGADRWEGREIGVVDPNRDTIDIVIRGSARTMSEQISEGWSTLFG